MAVSLNPRRANGPKFGESWVNSKGYMRWENGPNFSDVQRVMDPTSELEKRASALLKEGRTVEAKTLLRRVSHLWQAIASMEMASEDMCVACFTEQSILHSKYILALLTHTPEEIIFRIDRGHLGHKFLMIENLAEWVGNGNEEEVSRVRKLLQNQSLKGPGYYSPIGDADAVAKWRSDHEAWIAAVVACLDDIVAKAIATPAKLFTPVQRRSAENNIVPLVGTERDKS